MTWLILGKQLCIKYHACTMKDLASDDDISFLVAGHLRHIGSTII